MKFFIILLGALLCQSVHAGNLIFVAEGGFTNTNVEPRYRPKGGEDSTDYNSFAISGLVGYKFENNILIAGSPTYYAGLTVLDSTDRVNILDLSLQTGYSFNVAKNFRIVPMIGYSFWNLRSAQGAFLNSGPEEKKEFRGDSVYGKLNLEFLTSKLFAFNLSFTYGQYDFGLLRSLRFGARFELD